jgi:hypothetical protein
MMQVQVNLKTVGNGSTSKFEMNVNATDTVGSVKDKVAASQLIAFPEHHLAVKGEKMAEQKKLSEYGVSAGSELEFVLEATEKSVVKQLSELLQSRDLTCDELGLLYCYKHGVSTNQALKTIGIDMKLADFVKDQKEFVVEGKKVSVVRSDTALKPVSVAQQLETILREQGPTMDITTLCSKFIQKFHVSVASIVQMRPVEFIQQNKQTFAMIGDGLVTLKECEAREAAKVSASTASGSRVARSRSPGFVRSSSPQATRARSTERARPRTVALSQQKAENEEMYQELHTKISSRLVYVLTSVVSGSFLTV